MVAISPDNRWVVTGSSDQTARLWLLQMKDLMNLARITVGRNFSADEWNLYFPGERYHKTFPDLSGPGCVQRQYLGDHYRSPSKAETEASERHSNPVDSTRYQAAARARFRHKQLERETCGRAPHQTQRIACARRAGGLGWQFDCADSAGTVSGAIRICHERNRQGFERV